MATIADLAPPTVSLPARGKLLRVAWLSVFLGLAMEGLLLLAAVLFGGRPGMRAVVAESVQKVAWSWLVCVGLSLGALASGGRARGASVSGLLAAPVAFIVAGALHKGVAQALALAPATASGPPMAALALLKAIEYGVLGAALAGVARRPGSGFLLHAGAGLAIGLVFGAVALALLAPPTPQLFVARALNEVLFPAGCALVAFAARIFGAPRLGQDST